jgi:hypothetical protein
MVFTLRYYFFERVLVVFDRRRRRLTGERFVTASCFSRIVCFPFDARVMSLLNERRASLLNASGGTLRSRRGFARLERRENLREDHLGSAVLEAVLFFGVRVQL